MRSMSYALLAAASLLALPVQAQPLTDHNISMGMAMAIMQGTLEQCTKDGYKVSVVVVDKSGNTIASIKGDGTNPPVPPLNLTDGWSIAGLYNLTLVNP